MSRERKLAWLLLGMIAITLIAINLFVPDADASGLSMADGKRAARSYVHHDNNSHTRAAWLTGCWRGSPNRIVCDYKSAEDDYPYYTTCTGRVRAVRSRWTGLWVSENAAYYDCDEVYMGADR